MNKEVKIFTDGSSRGNPGRGGWGSIVAIDKDVWELGGREKNTTNNRMELTAVIKALEACSKIENRKLKIVIYTDSSYVLRGASIWVHGWAKNKWKTKQKKDVLNKDLWQKFLKASNGLKIDWKLLRGHSGIPANERCDEIATSFADGHKPKLHTTILQNYSIDLSMPTHSEKSANRETKTKKGVAYSYVSSVQGIVKTHKTWAECEKRVKGISNAKFKKSFSVSDEQKIITEFQNI